MKTKNNCKICKKKGKSEVIITRDKTKNTLVKCNRCQFAYLKGNPYKNLSKNKLNQSRLNFGPLGQITIKEDFQNNYSQSENEYNKYLDKKLIGKKILEIGPSWGAFLSLAKKKNIIPYGLEIDKKKSQFINSKLKIKCFTNYDYFKKNNYKFKKIFLFYVIEYFFNPEKEFKQILDLLDEDGKIVVITPNYNDVIKNVWKNKNYLNFFYEKNAKNYFSIKSLKNLLKKMKVKNFKIYNEQGYSLLNNLNWLFNGLPTKSNFVGKDNMIQELKKKIDNHFHIEKKNINQVYHLIKKADKVYKNICVNNQLGNQIHLEFKKN